MVQYYVGVDLGGTNIKAGVVDQDCRILAEDSRPTGLSEIGVARPGEDVCADIAKTVENALAQVGLSRSDVHSVGVGCPGTVIDEDGMVVYANNLGWRNVPMGQILEKMLGCRVHLGNDANVAALGEVCAGSAKGTNSAVIVTLGTGVGAGIVLDSHIYSGFNGVASEFGHMVIVYGGLPCTCGRRGCFESYASASGLIHLTRKAMEEDQKSLMWPIAKDRGKVSGRTAFDAMRQGDKTAARVVDDYIGYLACGITNIINALEPEIISMGGGISKEGETLLVPLREKVYKEIFGGPSGRDTRIEACTLGYKAGIIGAAMLAAED